MFDAGSRKRELDALRSEIEALRKGVEEAAERQEKRVRALLEEADARFAAALQARAALAARETNAALEDARRQHPGLREELDRQREFVEARSQTQDNLVRAMLGAADARLAEALEARAALVAREANAFAEAALQRQRAEMREEIDSLRHFVEARAQTQENLVRSMLAGADQRIAEALEPRIEVAASAALAFAERGLMQQQAALRTLGRRVAELAREASATAPAAWIAPTKPDAGAYAIGAAATEAQDCRRLEIRDEPEALFLADLAELPIPPRGATKLAIAHVVEFAPADPLERILLPHWRERLAPGGELVVVTLDGPAWTTGLARDAGDFDRLRARLAAQGRRPVRNLFDRARLADLMTRAGLTVVEDADAREPAPGTLRVVARAAS